MPGKSWHTAASYAGGVCRLSAACTSWPQGPWMLGIWLRTRCLTCSAGEGRTVLGRALVSGMRQALPHARLASSPPGLLCAHTLVPPGCIAPHAAAISAQPTTHRAAQQRAHLQAGLAAQAAAEVDRLSQHLLCRLVAQVDVPTHGADCMQGRGVGASRRSGW